MYDVVRQDVRCLNLQHRTSDVRCRRFRQHRTSDVRCRSFLIVYGIVRLTCTSHAASACDVQVASVGGVRTACAPAWGLHIANQCMYCSAQPTAPAGGGGQQAPQQPQQLSCRRGLGCSGAATLSSFHRTRLSNRSAASRAAVASLDHIGIGF